MGVVFQLGAFFDREWSHHLDNTLNEASAAGKMHRSVAMVIANITRCSAVDEQSHDGRLVGDYGQVESCLVELVVLKIEEGRRTGDCSHCQVHDRIGALTDNCQVQLPINITEYLTVN